jgi:DNA-damage-inducible protein J
MTTIQVRTKADLKANANKVLHNLGLDMSTAINMYLNQIVQKGGIPFPILTENGYTIQQEKEILAEIKDAYKHGKTYSSAQEMHDDILRELEEEDAQI